MTQDTLCFPPPLPEDVRVRIDRAMSDPELGACAKAVLIQLVGYPATGSGRAMSIEMIGSTFAVVGVRQYSPREIKSAVKSLIEDHGVPIGSVRSGTPGYFLIASPADREIAVRPIRGEVMSLLKRWRTLDAESAIGVELAGQLAIGGGGEAA